MRQGLKAPQRADPYMGASHAVSRKEADSSCIVMQEAIEKVTEELRRHLGVRTLENYTQRKDAGVYTCTFVRREISVVCAP